MAKKRANGEGSIRKRKDGRWEGRYTAGYDPKTGKRIIKNVLGKTQGEVKEKLKTAIAESQGLDVSKAADEYTVATWLRTWYELYAKPNVRTATANRYELIIETVVLLSKLNTKQHIEVELNLDELDLTAAESKATYDEIKAYVLEKYGLKVSSLYISQVKRKCGLDVGQNYNLSKKEDAKVPQCPPEKEAAIVEALKHFHMI